VNESAQAGLKAGIDSFLHHLRFERRLSPHTASNYQLDLNALLAFCADHEIAQWRQFDGQRVRMFAARQHSRGLGPRSIQRQLSAVRSFFNYLLREKQLPHNPAVDVRAPKAPKHLPDTLDPDAMARLLDFRGDDDLSTRDKAIMELLYSSGLRLQELVSLDLEHLLGDQTVRVTGKGNKTRIVPVGRYALEAISLWMAERAALLVAARMPEQKALFISRNGQRLGPRGIQKRIDVWAQRRGVNVKLHPHLFRHSFATHLLESSSNLRGVQELLGHANIGTTQIYTHLDFQHLARIYDASHPRAKRQRND
jgi:integrase/recombinase XerC